MQAKADIFVDQLKVAQTFAGKQQEKAPEVVEVTPVMVPTSANEGKLVCSFDYKEVEEQRNASAERIEARAAVWPRGSVATEVPQEPLIQEVPQVPEERGIKTKRPDVEEQQGIPLVKARPTPGVPMSFGPGIPIPQEQPESGRMAA